MITAISFLANNGALGGGEVMLLRMARAAKDLGAVVQVVGPTEPTELRQACEEAALAYVTIPGVDRRAYLVNLARQRGSFGSGLLWCNGLLPALAMAFARQERVIHLHQMPTGLQRLAALLASACSLATVVPSHNMQRHVRGSLALPNWTDPMEPVVRERDTESAIEIGFIGRLSPIKGIDILAEAIGLLEVRSPGRFRLLVAGDGRFVPAKDTALVNSKLSAIDRVTTRLGWVDRDCFYRSVDIAVVPSVWDEPFGLVSAEAMALGTPLVVSNAGALPEVVGPEYPWVARRGDPADLADKIEQVAFNVDQRQEVAQKARARWTACFSPEAGQQRFAALLASLGVDLGTAVGAPAKRSPSPPNKQKEE